MNESTTGHDIRDPAVLEAVYREHIGAIQRFVARRVEDPHDAADLVADVFVAAIESGHRYRPERGSRLGWLYGIAQNVVAGHARSRARGLRATGRISGRALVNEDDVERMVERIAAEEPARQLLARLADLPERQRAVVELVAVDGLTLTEAAAALGIAPGTARVRYHRARATLTHDLPLEVTP